ncbi:hypothetical protein Ahy_B03g063774 isoform A [Arachis hypogaea]|uniref:CBS domain-containing protein n=1 Tax=Arachis hypogaea TaxID=3818 RepID=A0A444ZY00_ARAHY|nr:hypothetical protein Ahy_B03g063774 isoform A [Arachis hypogaea]
MSGHIPPAPRRNSVHKRPPPMSNKAVNGITSEPPSKASSPPPPELDEQERTVRKLRLSKALTIPEGTTVFDACRRMAARRVNAVLLTDSNALLSGIMTDKDIATRVISEGLRTDQTVVSKVMTRNPTFVTSDTLAIDALQKMIQGKFRHLPVVENGEVIAILDITRCLYDAIFRLEKAVEQGSAIAATVEGAECQYGPNALIDTLREHMFKPSLSTLISEDTKVAFASLADPVYVVSLKMRELRVNSAVVVSQSGTKIQGILTYGIMYCALTLVCSSKDLLMRVVAQNLSPELTLVEKVMTPNPDCATLDTTIVDALHMMHKGKFLHLPVVDRDGYVAACLDVLQITHAAISLVESSTGAANDVANTIMQKFWDSALSLEPPEDSDTHSELSSHMTADGTERGKSPVQHIDLGNTFSFKLEDFNGHVHRFNCGTEHLDELVSIVMQRVELNDEEQRPTILYEDDEGDRIILATDHDLATAVGYARSAGAKAVKLHLVLGNPTKSEPRPPQSDTTTTTTTTVTQTRSSSLSMRSGIFAGAIAITSVGVFVYLRSCRK